MNNRINNLFWMTECRANRLKFIQENVSLLNCRNLLRVSVNCFWNEAGKFRRWGIARRSLSVANDGLDKLLQFGQARKLCISIYALWRAQLAGNSGSPWKLHSSNNFATTTIVRRKIINKTLFCRFACLIVVEQLWNIACVE